MMNVIIFYLLLNLIKNLNTKIFIKLHGNNYDLGYYSFKVNVGSNKQEQYLIFDTGSQIISLPCSSTYEHNEKHHIYDTFDNIKTGNGVIYWMKYLPVKDEAA